VILSECASPLEPISLLWTPAARLARGPRGFVPLPYDRFTLSECSFEPQPCLFLTSCDPTASVGRQEQYVKISSEYVEGRESSDISLMEDGLINWGEVKCRNTSSWTKTFTVS